MPYTVSVGYSQSGLKKFALQDKEMVDVFDPAFAVQMAAGISNAVSARKTDAWCLG